MNENEFDLAARAWLDDGPDRMSDRAVQSALDEIHTTRQRRAMWPAWRATPVSIFARMAAAAVLVVAVGLLAISIVPRQPDGSTVGGPSPSPSPSQAVDLSDLTQTFVSPRNGFSVKHPDGATVTPAIEDGFDVVETALGVVFDGASTELVAPAEVMIDADTNRTVYLDERIDNRLSDNGDFPGGCGVPRSQQAEITIDGQSGRIAECANRIEATVVIGPTFGQHSSSNGSLYIFRLFHDRGDPRAVFDDFVATIDLTPETAIHFPAMTTTFASPTYGYSFNYLDRNNLTPATELWDPANQPLDDINRAEFDVVETASFAVLESASTPIPDGVSIDEWVDEHVTPLAAGGCGMPRSQQAEISIDGQPARIAECPNRIEATVVAGGRLYLFVMSHQRSDAKAFFDAWVATIDLTPETAAVP